jgi:hypothetical protein
MSSEDVDAVMRMEALGRDGLIVSVCCGPTETVPFGWSVQLMTRDGEEFERPFAATSFSQAVLIAEIEAVARGWR